jgi:ABC-type branched-subunit amino acid transport system ATPase component
MFVKEVIHMLELEDIQDNLVGSREAGGLSFEQRKRLTIGVELIANPAILVHYVPFRVIMSNEHHACSSLMSLLLVWTREQRKS